MVMLNVDTARKTWLKQKAKEQKQRQKWKAMKKES